MNLPLVSINIPVYKVEQYIERCLQSVVNQSYKNIEIILVNDCSPDKSMEVAEDFLKEKTDFKVKYIHHQENSGLSVGRNNGILHSEGKYIYMLDSDDYITPDCIEKLVKTSEATDAEITVGQTICFDSHDGKEKMLFPIQYEKDVLVGNRAIFKEFVDGGWPIIAPNKLYRKDFIEKHQLRFVKGLFSQDELWAFHCCLVLERMAFIRDVTYIYYFHGASTIFNRKKINFENYITIIQHFTDTYNATKDTERKQLIKKKLIGFKEMVLMMQWKAMKEDVGYWKENYSRLKKAPSLGFSDYFSDVFSWGLKKKNIFLNLPVSWGYRLFKWRYER